MAEENILDQNKLIVTRLNAAACSGAVAAVADRAVDEHFAPDFVIHNTFPGMASDVEGTKEWNAVILQAIPDYHVKIDDQIAENDKVVTRWTARGTHKGEFQGIAPTGKKVVVSGMTISRYVDSKIAESWVELDTLDLMRQLGAHPSHDGRGTVTVNISIKG
jgi:predicted ester cyclase